MAKQTLGKEGCHNGDDSWFHNLSEDDLVVDKVNREYRTTTRKSELYLDLDLLKGRKLDTTKLIKKRVLVKRADGSTFYREQWVKPYEAPTMDESTGKQEEETKQRVLPLESTKTEPLTHDVEMYPELEASKKKSYDVSTQKGFIDEKLDGMSKEEKNKLIQRYGVTWDEHPNEQRNWMLAVMALKDHMYKNPHLLGAEHLSKEGSGDPIISGIDRETQWCNDLGREKCYQLMKEYGIGDGIDPKVADPDDKGAPIKHMRNMMALKEYLKQNPYLMDEKTVAKTSKTPTPAEKGGNDIHEILKKMSNDEKYKLAVELGICKGDPKKDPYCYDDVDKKGEKLHPDIKHMRNMMELKKRIELEPSILIKDAEDELRPVEKKRISDMDKDQEKQHNIKEICSKLSRESKQRLLKKYADREQIKNRKTNENEHIDWMLSMTALKELMSSDNSVYDDAFGTLKEESVSTFKFGNKQLEKVLRGIGGFTSKSIDYVKVVEPNREWEFGLGSSVVKQMNDDGEWVLSILDTGYDGSEWNEQEILVKDAIKFLEDYDSRRENPLYNQDLPEIIKAIGENFKLYDKRMDSKLKPLFTKAWKNEKTDNLSDLLVGMDGMSMDLACNLLDKWDVPVSRMGDFATVDVDSNKWKDIAYADLIHSKKQFDVSKYVPFDMEDNPDIYPLIESAKKWSAEEKHQARMEMIDSSLSIQAPSGFSEEQVKQVRTTLNSYITECLDITPFEILADMTLGSQDPLKISISQDIQRSNYNLNNNTISLNRRYVNNYFDHQHDNPLDFHAGTHPFVETLCHEWAHALDGFLGNGRFLYWSGENAQKYVPEKNRNCIMNSFNSKIGSSNPDKQLIKVPISDGKFEYYYKDEWMSNYEGRAYGVNEANLKKDENGNLYDNLPQGKYSGALCGVEHFSENIARYGSALVSYKQWRKENAESYEGNMDKMPSFDKWCKDMESWYEQTNLGDDYTESVHGEKRESYRNGYYSPTIREGTYINRDNFPKETYGYLYSTLKKRHPELQSFINNVLDRPDFSKTKDVQDKPTERVSSGQPIRKGLYINL